MKRYIIMGLMICMFLFSGCAQEGIEKEKPTSEPEFAKSPAITLEATIVSLSPDTNIECENQCPGYQYPKDTAVIRINKVISVDNPYNWELIGAEENSEITIQFLYSSRPTKIERIPASVGAGGNESTISHVPAFAKPIPKEDGYFIYRFESTLVSEETETILPGLEAESTFRATVSYSSPTTISVGEYEIIS